ncbi:MAG: hypothetical protein ACLRFK_01125 [Alphaproteobacteria bacterium]
MIKKIICAFLLCFVTFLSHGDTTKKYTVIKGQSEINLYADRTIAVLQSFFPEEQLRESVITGILDSLKGETKGKKFGALTMDQLEYICRVGGYDLSDDQDIDKCIKFVQAFASLSVDSYLEACGIDKDTPGAETHCINDVFYHYGDGGINTQVTMLEAVNLSKEYLRMHPKKYSDDIIECSNEPRDDNYIQCRSMTGPTYYEFMFDDLTENKDKTADESLEEAICSLHDVEYSAAYHSPARYDDMGFKITDAVSAPSLCHTKDEKKCSDINETAQKFARKAIFRNNKCVLEYRDKLTLDNLRTNFGINNMQFSMGIQMMSSANMPDKLCEYIRNNADTTITDCYCDAAKQRVENDDVLTCFANGEPIDFLFDDLNEGSSTKQKAGLEGFNCELSGAQYQGKTCYVPDAKICEQIADMMAKDCPNCQRIRYNKDVNACVLPSSIELIEEHELKKVALIAGGAVLSGVIVVASGGTAGSVVYLVIETVGAGMEFGAQIHIDGVADEFLLQANNCNDATCAERILREFFAYLSRMTNDLHDTELLGIDRQMARLINSLPNDSQFLIDTVAGCYENNGDDFDISKCDDGKWNDDQIIRAVGIGLQFTSVVASVGKWVLGTTKIANKIPNSIKALKNKISGVKSKIAKGGKVTRSDGKAVKALGVTKADDAARAAAYENKLRAAYEKYAPKNQSFDDFKKIFKDEAAFDRQLAAWESFEPGMVDMSDNPRFPKERYVATPYSTYDPKLNKQLKAIDAEYADDIAKIQAEVDESRRQFSVFEDAKKAELREEERAAKEFGAAIKKADDEYTQAITQLEDEIKGLSGNARATKEAALQELQNAHQAFRREQENYLLEMDVDIAPDWSKDNPLQPLLDDYADRRWTPRESDYTPEQWAYYVEKEGKENLKQGYEVARDYEKSKLINATISDDVADAVAETRRQELIDIIADDDELFAQAQRFSDLSVTEKQAFLQKVHDKLDDVTHVKGMFKVHVYEDPKSSIVANAARRYNNKPLGKELDIDEILETIVHEQSHVVDKQAPDLGMLGAQKAKERITLPYQDTQWEIRYDWTTGTTTQERVKSIEGYEIYRANPTEFSSWKVGGSGKENMMQKIIEKRAAK